MRTATLLLLVLTNTAHASLLAPWVSRNVMLGGDPAALPAGSGLNQAEPHAIRSVTDPDLILATFQEGRFADGGSHSSGYAVSEDGGFTWRRGLNPRLTRINGGPYYRASDPVGGISHDGTLYLNSLVAIDPDFNVGRLVVQRSRDRGRTWTDPVTVFTGFNNSSFDRVFPDKNWMVVNDDASSMNAGRVVVTWTNFRTVPGLTNNQDYLIVSAYSDDDGETWSGPVYVTPPGLFQSVKKQYQGSQPVFLPGGGLAIVFHNFLSERLEVSYSPDGGERFPFSPEPIHSGYIRYDSPNMRDGSFLPSVNVARESGDLFIAYTARDSQSAANADIFFTRSERSDGGGSPENSPDWKFRNPVRITHTLASQVIATPTLAVSPDGAVVTVYYYDNRNGPAINTNGDFYAVQSTDGGTTWSEPFRLTENTFDLRNATPTDRGYMIGDYFGFAAPKGPGQAGVAVWVDTRSGNADPWSARIGNIDGPGFASWLQANLPFSIHNAGMESLRYADHDRDGAPDIIEYVTGRDPLYPEENPTLRNGAVFLVLDTSTDPGTVVVVSPGTGRWPVFRSGIGVNPTVSPHGEGYWTRQQWSTTLRADHFRFSINDQENWYLLGEDSFLRWVLEFPDSWIWSPWFGWTFTQSAPWLFHLSLGWLYDVNGILYSSAFSTYLYPDISTYPWIYTQQGRYLYIVEDSPWVYDSGSGAWIRAY